jgi:hypothetical protein
MSTAKTNVNGIIVPDTGSLADKPDPSDLAAIDLAITNLANSVGYGAGTKFGVMGATPAVQGAKCATQALTLNTLSISGLAISGVSYGAEYENINTLVSRVASINDNLSAVITAVNQLNTQNVTRGFTA